MKYLFIIIFALTALTPKAVCDDDMSIDSMESRGFVAYKSKKELNEKKMGERIQKTYNTLVKFGVFRMKRKGYNAEPLQKQWDALYSNHFLSFELGVNSVEDHDPALKWLNDFYLLLVDVIGESSVRSMHLDDINLLNRSVVTVFHPKGSDKVDYKDCFTRGTMEPAGYWATMLGCSLYVYLGTSPAVIVCGPIASGARIAFGIAGDPIGSAIWHSVNK